MDIDSMHHHIAVSLVDAVLSDMQKMRQVLTTPNVPDQVQTEHLVSSIQSMDRATRYLRGDFMITDKESAKRAKELDEKEPQFIAVAEQNQRLKAENTKLIKRMESLGEAGEIPTTFPCPKCKKEFATRRGVVAHNRWCGLARGEKKPKKAAPKKKKKAAKKKAPSKKAKKKKAAKKKSSKKKG